MPHQGLTLTTVDWESYKHLGVTKMIILNSVGLARRARSRSRRYSPGKWGTALPKKGNVSQSLKEELGQEKTLRTVGHNNVKCVQQILQSKE